MIKQLDRTKIEMFKKHIFTEAMGGRACKPTTLLFHMITCKFWLFGRDLEK